jgi:hypothetical protein
MRQVQAYRSRLWYWTLPLVVLSVVLIFLALAGIRTWTKGRELRPKTIGEYRTATERNAGANTQPVLLHGRVAMQGEWAFAINGWTEHRMIQNGKVLDFLVLEDHTGEVIVYYDPELLAGPLRMGTPLEVRARPMKSEQGPGGPHGLVADSIEWVQ